MSTPYFPMFPSDFEADTSHLTLEEDGAYNRLLRLMWMTPGCSLPDDDAWIQRRMRVDIDTFVRVALPIISEFMIRQNGRVFSPRLMREFKKVDLTSRKRSAAGKLGGRPQAIDNNSKDGKPGFDFAKAGLSYARALPEPEPEPDSSEGKPSGKMPLSDPTKAMFDSGISMLVAAGKTETQARAVLGKWKRDHGAEAVIVALGKAQREGAVDPVSFCEGVFRFRAKKAEPQVGDEIRGPDGYLRTYEGAFAGWVTDWSSRVGDNGP